MHRGFITLHRKIREWEWYGDSNTFRVFTELLLTANHKPSNFRGQIIERGQVVVGRKKLAQTLNISEQSIRTSLNRLKSTNEITIKSTSKFSIVTLINYGVYNDKNQQSTNKTTSELTSNQPTTNQQLTTSKQLKQYNNENNIYNDPSIIDLESRKNKLSTADLINKTFELVKPLGRNRKDQVSPIEQENLKAAIEKGCTGETVQNLLKRLPQISNFNAKWPVDELLKQFELDQKAKPENKLKELWAGLEEQYGSCN